MATFADVAVNVPLRAGDRVFTFSVPAALESLIEVGVPVRVPFGRQMATGFVVNLAAQTSRGVKPIAGVEARIPALPADLVSLAAWMADYYVSSVGEAIWAMLPPLGALSRKNSSAPIREAQPPTSEVSGELRGDPSGIITRLTAHFPARVAILGEDARFQAYEAVLQWVVSRPAGSIWLVPEVSQAERLFSWVARRTAAPAALLHGGQPDRQRWETWRQIRSGEVRVVVGTRLAVFAPVVDLALIVIDHEEDASYKEERVPRYHARRVAEERAALVGAAVLWGTPTPSMELERQMAEDRAARVTLPPPQRPTIALSDVRAEAGPLGGLFGRRLYQALARTLPRGRAIIFVPRRGFADFLLCHECGWVPRCPRCGVAMTYHVRQTKLRCHLCNTTEPAPQTCRVCHGTHLRPHGVGTERVEQTARRLFRGTPLLRLDSDVAPDEEAQQQIWQQYGKRGGLLVGTQLLVKGVGQVPAAVVGAVGVDTGLHLPDFRAAERTYQVLMQLAGLAQREMIIQTFSPSHPALVAVARQDAAKFYAGELAARQRFGYPPFHALVNLILTGSDTDAVRDAAEQLATLLADAGEVLGPSPAPLARVRGRYRWQVLVKEKEEGVARRRLQEVLRTLALPKEMRLAVDVDPVDLL